MIDFREGNPGVRQPRAIIFDMTKHASEELASLFRKRGFETLVFRKAISCPVMLSGSEQDAACSLPVPCSDIMIVIEEGVQTEGKDILAQQAHNKCILPAARKALVTTTPDSEAIRRAFGPGMAVFGNPMELPALEAWIESCETQIDLSQRLAARRHEKRVPCGERIHVRISDAATVVDPVAQLINIGSCGACVLTTYPLEHGQPLRITGPGLFDAEDSVVRWVHKLNGWHFQAGLTFCV